MPALMLVFQAEHMHDHASAMASRPDVISLFDHHFAGVLLILLGIIAYLEQTRLADRHRWIRFLWPLPLLLLGTFLLVFRDRKEPWFDWLLQGMFSRTEVQHKIFESVAIAVGLIELLRRTGQLQSRSWRQILNTLMLTAGIFLLFHHGHHAHIVHLEHLWMGLVAVTLSLAKIVSDQGWSGRWLGLYAVPLLFLTLGLQFALYVE